MLKAFWKDPVWSKVIATAILAIIGVIGTYALNLWPAITHFFSMAITFAASSSKVANWLIGAAILFALPTIFFGAILIWSLVFPPAPTELDWKNYQSDNFFGIKWRWKYAGNRMSDMHTFCPHCDFQIYPSNAGMYNLEVVTFHCDSCHTPLGRFEESYESLENKAFRFAQQKIRNGTWCAKSGT